MPRTSPLVAPILAVLAVAAVPPAQDVWSPMHGVGPSARERHAAAYDSASGFAVLFGGHDGSALLGDTWRWDGEFWTDVTAAGPPARSGHAMAYDAARDRVVLFGGHDGVSELGDTWEWDGISWSSIPVTGPSPRRGHAMAYDAARARVVLFGGHDGVSELGDTWAFDGATWTPVAGAGPAPRMAHALAYDGLRDQVVLFGGEDAATVFGDTWVLSGSWTQAATTGPSARSGAGLAYDGHRGRVVLFGGDTGGGSFAGDTWAWDSASWTQIALSASGPSPRAGHALVSDVQRRRVTLFGGAGGAPLGDTWTLFCAPWCDLGYGVPGAHGPPQLTGAGRLQGGAPLSLTVTNAAAQSTAVLLGGASPLYASFFAGTIVPDPVLSLPLSIPGTVGSPATLALGPWTLPAGTSAGGTLYFQTWILDPAGSFGLAASNAIVGTTRQSLYARITSAFDAMLATAAPPASSLAIYSVQDFTNRVFVRNPSCWAARLDLTGLSPWNQAYANTRAGTLVSPRHVVFAKHYPLSTTTGNNEIAFVTQQNVTVIRKLVSVTYPARDIGVGLLDADVPPDIRFYKVLPQVWNDFLPQTNGLPMLHLDQEEKALVRDMTGMTSATQYTSHVFPSSALRRPFAEALIGGDSGNPAFVVVNGEPILILTHHYATAGPFYTFFLSAVNAAMTQLGGGYQLTEVDLSTVPR